MAFRDLLTIVTRSSAESAFAASEVLATRWGAQITTLHLSEAPTACARIWRCDLAGYGELGARTQYRGAESGRCAHAEIRSASPNAQ